MHVNITQIKDKARINVSAVDLVGAKYTFPRWAHAQKRHRD